MRLPNWVLLFTILVAAMAQYSSQVHANSLQQTGNVPLGTTERNMAYTNAFSLAPEMATKSAQGNNTINLNSAKPEQLSSLPGIGLKKAEAIVAYRELNGDFESVDELLNVKGIGPKMLAKLQGLISI